MRVLSLLLLACLAASAAFGAEDDDFSRNFTPAGRPKATFTRAFRKRFKERLNRAVDPASQSEAERAKWTAIFAELTKAGDISNPERGRLLFINGRGDPKEAALAREYSRRFEDEGEVQTHGAWSIAVLGTAVRHGFPEVPCAEFMSEMLREAYKRAGYDFRDDFNERRDNPLYWTNTDAVVNLTTALDRAGWIPWDAAFYRPPTGAIIMNADARTPGHAYMAAGADGTLIVDNGSPLGRDLRETEDRLLKMMYQNGLFFLPPGIVPQPWPEEPKPGEALRPIEDQLQLLRTSGK